MWRNDIGIKELIHNGFAKFRISYGAADNLLVTSYLLDSVSVTPLLPLAAASIKPRLQRPSPTRRLQSNIPSVTTL